MQEDHGSEMGPLITKEHRDRVASYLDAARNQGASVEVEGAEVILRPREQTSSSALL
jgi:malonate-semialdehyde dehydrogenase (acetylating) / methylmalonate-semialdehyde dehydrogenase